jgi:integrase
MATVKIRYLLRKAGLLYYQRGIPPDLRPHYSGRALILINLKTLDLSRAAKLCSQYGTRDDALWRTLRSPEGKGLTTEESREAAQALIASWGAERGSRPDEDSPIWERVYAYMVSRHGEAYELAFDNDQDLNPFYSPIEKEALRLVNERRETRRVLLSDALERYLSEHKRGQDQRFACDARRAIGIVTRIVGDLPLGEYTRDHARIVRDALSPKHSTATVRRRLDSICAIFNLGKREFDLQNCTNPFEKLAIPGEGLDATKRLPFTHDELQTISRACREVNDDIRWLIGIQLATGSRLGEIVGLRREDVCLDHEIPHIIIQPHEALGRTLKTPGSTRVVPLLGIGLWAARRAMMAAWDTGWLFPRYASDKDIRATHASNTINKWLSETLGIPKTTHSLRHSMKDLLRDAGVAEEVSKVLLGHGSRSISDQYGQGFSLQRLKEALAKALQKLS